LSSLHPGIAVKGIGSNVTACFGIFVREPGTAAFTGPKAASAAADAIRIAPTHDSPLSGWIDRHFATVIISPKVTGTPNPLSSGRSMRLGYPPSRWGKLWANSGLVSPSNASSDCPAPWRSKYRG